MNDADKLDGHWLILRISSGDLPGKHLLTVAVQEPVAEPSVDEHSLKDAVAVYLRFAHYCWLAFKEGRKAYLRSLMYNIN